MPQYSPDTIDDVHLALRGLSHHMEVEIEPGIPLAAAATLAKPQARSVAFVGDGTFDVRGVQAAGPRSRSTATSLPPALEALVRPEPLRAHRLVLAFERDGQPQQSAGYLAYKQLYFFKGRITRDRWVEQAGYLARGDTAGFEAQFGKLG